MGNSSDYEEVCLELVDELIEAVGWLNEEIDAHEVSPRG